MGKQSSWNDFKPFSTRSEKMNISKDVHRFSLSNWVIKDCTVPVTQAAPAPGWMVPALSPIRWLWGYYLTAEAGPGLWKGQPRIPQTWHWTENGGQNHVIRGDLYG